MSKFETHGWMWNDEIEDLSSIEKIQAAPG